ncbi:uncharacterized protein TRIVIDRAFT_216900 [Trichoderma virens Gv29-8]|uniref:Uncharacterized protein n=1 Tax=Hypocrea virens (strain Gv29-8 / FGSC 10586) TaxID=413071 RepID=G9N7W3_HYPVG|nr:uncharacterized protein TRIVIDRAFT_216900 [Trichoderma virens Gv29-8]EHK17077.1 hypothetical protein TRIVIDRAFT_216900 [Trichoderma virens Gv29-8]UKZ55489.1 hypothetical protein TrVGV298_009313 [Trichoderma virens]
MGPVPSPEVRAAIAAKLDALIQAVETNPHFSRSSSSGGLYHVWDFAQRTKYMLSEIDGIRQEGYQFKHAGQIKITKRGEDAAKELYMDTFTRSITLDQLVSGPPLMRTMMGMAGEISPEIQAAAKAVVEAFPA